MAEERRYSGGCLCGALRWEAKGEPLYQGHCYCADCRKASGSGFVPYMGFPAASVSITGETLSYGSPAANGNIALRNSCPKCGSLVFGGDRGRSEEYTIYAGSLDDPGLFAPNAAIFTRGKPEWSVIPAHFAVFEQMPPEAG